MNRRSIENHRSVYEASGRLLSIVTLIAAIKMELGLAHDNQAFFFYSEFKKERVEMSGIRLQPRVPQKDWWLLFKMMEQWRDHYYSIEDIHWADRFPEEIQEFIVEMAIVHGSVK